MAPRQRLSSYPLLRLCPSASVPLRARPYRGEAPWTASASAGYARLAESPRPARARPAQAHAARARPAPARACLGPTKGRGSRRLQVAMALAKAQLGARELAWMQAVAASRAFVTVQFNFLAQGNFLAYGYTEYAECVADFTRSHDVATLIYNSVLAQARSFAESAAGAGVGWSDKGLTDASAVARAAPPASLATDTVLQQQIGMAYVTGSLAEPEPFATLFAAAYNSATPVDPTRMPAATNAAFVAATTISAAGGGAAAVSAGLQSVAMAYTQGGSHADPANATVAAAALTAATRTLQRRQDQAMAGGVVRAVATAAGTAAKMSEFIMPDKATAGGYFRPLPRLWGIDRFPCSRGTLLDVFREGDFDYPYRLKQLDRVSKFLLAWEWDVFTVPRTVADCKRRVFLEPLRRGVYWQVFLDPRNVGTNWPALDAAEAALAAYLRSIGSPRNPTTAQIQGSAPNVLGAFILAGGKAFKSDGSGDTLTMDAGFAATEAGQAFAKQLVLAVSTAALTLAQLDGGLRQAVQAFGVFGYWWRPSFGDAWDFVGTQLTDDQIAALALEAANGIGNRTVEQCVAGNTDPSGLTGQPVRACLLSWGATTVPRQVMVGQNDPLAARLDNIVSHQLAWNSYDEDHPAILRTLRARLGTGPAVPATATGAAGQAHRLELLMRWEKEFLDRVLKPAWRRDAGTGFEEGKDFASVQADMMMGRSVRDLVSESAQLRWSDLVGGYVCLVAYGGLCHLGLRSSVLSHALLGGWGIITVTLSTIAAFGLYGYAALPSTGLAAGVLPFVSLGVGAVDMFVMSAAYADRVRAAVAAGEGASAVEAVVGDVLRDTGPSITFTTLVNLVAALVAAQMPIKVVQLFCYQMAVAVVANLILLLLLFVPAVVLDCHRTLRGISEYGVTLCSLPKSEPQVSEGKEEPKPPCLVERGEPIGEAGGGLGKEDSPIARMVRNYYGPVLLSAPVAAFVLVGFLTLAAVLGWNGFHTAEVGLKVSDFSNIGSYQRAWALRLEKQFNIYPGSLFLVSQNMPASQQVLLDALEALGRDKWLDKSLDITASNWLGGSSSSLMAQFNSSAPKTPIPADEFNRTLNTWLLGLGALSAPNLWCYDGKTGKTADCFDRLPPVSNPDIQVGASRVTFYLINQRDTPTITSAMDSTRAAVDAVAAGPQAARVSAVDPGFRLFVTGYTYSFFEQYRFIWRDLYNLVGFSLLGVFLATLAYHPDLSLSLCVCAVILAVYLETFGLMPLYGVALNAFSATNLALSAGMSTELSVHYAYAFLARRGASRRRRAVDALAGRLEAETHGLATSVLAFLFVLTAPLAFAHAYYFGMFVSVAGLAFLNGVVLLPVLLLCFGSSAPAKSSDEPNTPNQAAAAGGGLATVVPEPPPMKAVARQPETAAENGPAPPAPIVEVLEDVPSTG